MHTIDSGSCKNLGGKKNYNCLLQVIVSAARPSNIQCGAACARCHASRRETKIIQPNQFFRCLIKISCRTPPLNGVCVARNFSTDQRTILSRFHACKTCHLPQTTFGRISKHGRDSRIRTSSPLSEYPNIRTFYYPYALLSAQAFRSDVYVQHT